jgi:hypothetical protein
MRQPKSLDEAKQIFREEKAKVATSLSALAGSRWLTAILATLVIAFGTHAIYAPESLPTLNWLQWQNVGMPPSVDFGFAGEQWEDFKAAAAAHEAAAKEKLAENAERYPAINWSISLIALALLLGNMWVMTKRRPYSRG